MATIEIKPKRDCSPEATKNDLEALEICNQHAADKAPLQASQLGENLGNLSMAGGVLERFKTDPAKLTTNRTDGELITRDSIATTLPAIVYGPQGTGKEILRKNGHPQVIADFENYLAEGDPAASLNPNGPQMKAFFKDIASQLGMEFSNPEDIPNILNATVGQTTGIDYNQGFDPAATSPDTQTMFGMLNLVNHFEIYKGESIANR